MSTATKINEATSDACLMDIRVDVRTHETLTPDRSGFGGRSATKTFAGRLGGLVAPIAAVAAFAAPVPDSFFRTRRWGTPAATVPVIRPNWMEESSWRFTEAVISQAEIDALNALLALPVAEGFSLQHADE
jgi:hypothetical protein